MNIEIINSLYAYFETLYNLNRKLITICGIDIMNNRHSIILENKILEIIQDIPRLIPYTKKKGKIEIDNNDGLIEFSDEILYIKKSYDDILQKNYGVLMQIKDVRNKYEHKMHGIKIVGKTSYDKSVIELIFNLKVRNNGVEEEVDYGVDLIDIINLVKHINLLFGQLQRETIEFVEKDEELKKYYNYKRISRFTFLDFNKIYDNEILNIIGRVLLDF